MKNKKDMSSIGLTKAGEFASALGRAGFDLDMAQSIINSKKNELAKHLYRYYVDNLPNQYFPWQGRSGFLQFREPISNDSVRKLLGEERLQLFFEKEYTAGVSGQLSIRLLSEDMRSEDAPKAFGERSAVLTALAIDEAHKRNKSFFSNLENRILVIPKFSENKRNNNDKDRRTFLTYYLYPPFRFDIVEVHTIPSGTLIALFNENKLANPGIFTLAESRMVDKMQKN